MARAFAGCVRDGDLIVLSGDLGAGKTCFSQGFGAGLGVKERITSPTFTLHNQYRGRLILNHLDVYRLDDLEETLDLDLPEMLETGVTIIEWGEQIDPTLPSDHLTIRILHGSSTALGEDDPQGPVDDDLRSIVFEFNGPIWLARLGQLEAVIQPWEVPC